MYRAYTEARRFTFEKAKKVYGKRKLSDGKPIGGVGHLTDKDINRLIDWHHNKKQHRKFMGYEKGNWGSVLSLL